MARLQNGQQMTEEWGEKAGKEKWGYRGGEEKKAIWKSECRTGKEFLPISPSHQSSWGPSNSTRLLHLFNFMFISSWKNSSLVPEISEFLDEAFFVVCLGPAEGWISLPSYLPLYLSKHKWILFILQSLCPALELSCWAETYQLLQAVKNPYPYFEIMKSHSLNFHVFEGNNQVLKSYDSHG